MTGHNAVEGKFPSAGPPICALGGIVVAQLWGGRLGLPTVRRTHVLAGRGDSSACDNEGVSGIESQETSKSEAHPFAKEVLARNIHLFIVVKGGAGLTGGWEGC